MFRGFVCPFLGLLSCSLALSGSLSTALFLLLVNKGTMELRSWNALQYLAQEHNTESSALACLNSFSFILQFFDTLFSINFLVCIMRNKDIAVSNELGSVDVQAIRTNHEAKKSVCTVAFKTDTTIK